MMISIFSERYYAQPLTLPPLSDTQVIELRQLIDRDPHRVGVRRANWTTHLLATYLAAQPQVGVTAETVRLYLRAAGGVCKRPTWTLKRKAEAQPGYVGNVCGWRESWPGPARRRL